LRHRFCIVGAWGTALALTMFLSACSNDSMKAGAKSWCRLHADICTDNED